MKNLLRLALMMALLSSCTVETGGTRSKGTPTVAPADDPTLTDGDKYKVVLENERVRVLRYQDKPGDRTQLHHHPHDFVLVALAPFRRALSFADGTRKELAFETGQVKYVPEQSHAGENIGQVDSNAILVELKGCAATGGTP